MPAGSVFAAAALAVLALLGGCARQTASGPSAEPAQPIVWPQPPEQARIAYVQSIYRPADFGIKVGAFARFGRWLTGSEKGNEPLIKPFGIALDEDDNICLTDTGANVVCFYDRTKKQWRRWDRIGNIRFSAPVAVAKRHGVIYVADSALGKVVAFDQNAKLVFQITNHLEHPAGLAILGDQLFVADSRRHCVVVFDLRGSYRSEFGRRGTGPGEFNFPTHLTADAAGTLYVTDSMNGRVQMLDAQGRFKAQAGILGDRPGQFGRPKGVAVDSFGHLYAIDALFDNLQVFDQGGRILLSVGAAGPKPGEFWLPNGVAISRTNEIFITDSYNRRVQILKYIGSS